MVDKGYNGWSNYETWNVKLWIDNDEGSYEMWRERTRECWEANWRAAWLTIHAILIALTATLGAWRDQR